MGHLFHSVAGPGSERSLEADNQAITEPTFWEAIFDLSERHERTDDATSAGNRRATLASR